MSPSAPPPPRRPPPANAQAGATAVTLEQAMQGANAAYERGAWGEAELLCRKVLHAKADCFDALELLGIIAAQTRRTQEAAELLGRAVAENPTSAAAHNSYANTLQQLRRLDEALASYDRALELKPDYAQAYNNRGNTLKELKRLDEALDSYDRALKIKPDSAPAYNNRGVVLQALKRLDEALDSYDRALEIKPDYADVYYNRGLTLQDLRRLDEAVDSYDRALEIKPDYAEAYNNRGVTLEELRRLDEAVESYGRALKIKPDLAFAYGAWLQTKMTLCDWSDLENQVTELFRRIENREKATAPFHLLALTSSLSLQRIAAEVWVNEQHPASLALPLIAKSERRKKIRIGYYSADYHNHATAYLMAELIERHDRSKFEPSGFSFGPDNNDEMRKRIAAAFDQFVDVRHSSDREVARQSRNMGMDIAVDLKGFTQDSRTGVFAMRAAPIQVNYLGFPGTMGAAYIDYLIADSTLVPDTSRQYYSEKIAYLPNSYQVNDRTRAISDKAFSREELGLPRTGFVFCCFNNNYKITPSTFDGWMRILKQVDGSVLWLLQENVTAASNLRREASARGVGAERLIFAQRIPLADHLARHRAADLFVDTLPCNAHTTASDALWAGLPLLTCIGHTFAGRVAASVLKAIDLPELITTTREQYEAAAVGLATNPERLNQIKHKLERNRLTMPLFDTQLFTRHIEDAYMQMYERYQADLPPDHIYVSS